MVCKHPRFWKVTAGRWNGGLLSYLFNGIMPGMVNDASNRLQSVFSQFPALQLKLTQVRSQISEMERVAVAFSGGVDSATLLKICVDQLGTDCLAVIGNSATFPAAEFAAAKQLAQDIGAQHVVIDTNETAAPEFLTNSPQRCFHCRNITFSDFITHAQSMGFPHLVDGANADDQGDYRPGRKAAQALGVASPLLEAGITKNEVRLLANAFGLPVWDKPSSACLASRIPYNMPITLTALQRIETGEQTLKQLGFRDVRLRHYDDLARIEVLPEQLDEALEKREAISAALKQAGYLYITLDLEGLRSGSMNLAILND